MDVLRILFNSAGIEASDEDKPGVIIDYDKAGNIVCMENPRSVEVEYAAAH